MAGWALKDRSSFRAYFGVRSKFLNFRSFKQFLKYQKYYKKSSVACAYDRRSEYAKTYIIKTSTPLTSLTFFIPKKHISWNVLNFQNFLNLQYVFLSNSNIFGSTWMKSRGLLKGLYETRKTQKINLSNLAPKISL